MKKQNKLIIAFITLIVLIGIFFGVSKLTSPKPVTGSKDVTVEVVDKESKSKEYVINTDAEFLSDLMDELVKTTDFTYEASKSEYGLYIETINGLKADYSVDGAYWAIYVNGEYGQYGADQQPVTSGDKYSLVYEVSSN